jgi:hypothetical protein
VWTRACLGNRDDLRSVAVVTLAASLAVALVVVDLTSWAQGTLAFMVLTCVPGLVLWRRRRFWDEVMEAECEACLIAVEDLLRRRRTDRDSSDG